jgi:hypothetical protein
MSKTILPWPMILGLTAGIMVGNCCLKLLEDWPRDKGLLFGLVCGLVNVVLCGSFRVIEWMVRR